MAPKRYYETMINTLPLRQRILIAWWIITKQKVLIERNTMRVGIIDIVGFGL